MFRILCFAVIVGITSAATWQGFTPPVPKEHAHKKGCYVSEIDDVIPFGEEITPRGHCYRIECSGSMMYYASCGKVYTDDPKCYITETDTSKPYPECCPDIKCDNDNDIGSHVI